MPTLDLPIQTATPPYRPTAQRIHLISDDLTGALDTAAQFVCRTGPVVVYWDAPEMALPPNVAVGPGRVARCILAEAAETVAAT